MIDEEIKKLTERYSKEIQLGSKENRIKLDIIKEIAEKLKDKDYDKVFDENNYPGITSILIYEYSVGLEKLTNGKLKYEDVIEKLTGLMGKLRVGKWEERDSNIEYNGMKVTEPNYRDTEGKNFGAQTCEYLDNNNLQMAVVLYDKMKGKGIDLLNLNDIRHTLFHELTHVMELDKLEDLEQEIQVPIGDRVFVNNIKMPNNEIFGVGLSTREYGENAKKYATNKDRQKRIMHNQITEGFVELISRKIMQETIGKEESEKVIDKTRYIPHTKVAQIVMDTYGEDEVIYTYATHSQKLVEKLEENIIDGRDSLHYMSDFINDRCCQGIIPQYSDKTRLMQILPLKLFALFKIDNKNQKNIGDEFTKHEIEGTIIENMQSILEKYSHKKLSKKEYNTFLQLREKYQNIIQKDNEFYSTLQEKLKGNISKDEVNDLSKYVNSEEEIAKNLVDENLNEIDEKNKINDNYKQPII